jgi:hypothetical protein
MKRMIAVIILPSNFNQLPTVGVEVNNNPTKISG